MIGVALTRMELQRLKKRLKLAKKGHKLLKEKRDILIMEFFNILEKAKNLREEAEEKINKAFKSLILSEAYHGTTFIERISNEVGKIGDINISYKNIMGVKVPSFKLEDTKRNLLERGYELYTTSLVIDDTARKFEESLRYVIKLAEIEKSLILLAEEIQKTKRRVNILEKRVIPNLELTIKFIQMKLDEMERENFMRLKRIKSMLEKKAR